MKKSLLYVILGLCVALVGIGSAYVTLYQQKSSTPDIGGDFTLIGADGKPVAYHDSDGFYRIVMFGFTHCPDICPTELQLVKTALGDIGDKAQQVKVLFITLDPARDTADVLASYLQPFGFTGLTGSEQAIADIARSYKIYYEKVPFGTDGDYMIEHTAYMFLMDKNGALLHIFRSDTTPADMSHTLDQTID